MMELMSFLAAIVYLLVSCPHGRDLRTLLQGLSALDPQKPRIPGYRGWAGVTRSGCDHSARVARSRCRSGSHRSLEADVGHAFGGRPPPPPSPGPPLSRAPPAGREG